MRNYSRTGTDEAEKRTAQPVQETEKKSKTQEGKESEKKRRGRRPGSRLKRASDPSEVYKRYVYRVLKQVHPEMGVSSKAMTVLDNFMNDMFERLAEEAARLLKYTGRKTLTSREIPGGGAAGFARRAREARRCRGHQGCQGLFG